MPYQSALTSTIPNDNIHKTKTNRIDTFIIYKILMMYPHQFITPTTLEYYRLKKQKNSEKNLKQHTYFSPKYPYSFKSEVHHKEHYTFLKEVPSPETIASIHLTHLLKSSPTVILKRETTVELKVLAQRSIGNSDKSLSIQATHPIKEIELLDR